MNQNFIRINITLSKNRSNQPEKLSKQKEAKNLELFIFFKKRLGKDFLHDTVPSEQTRLKLED